MMLDACPALRYNPFISCEAEITDEDDLLESRGAGESPAGNDRSNGPPSAQGKKSILRRVVTVISRGMCWHFHEEPDFTDRETRWHRESIVLVSA